MHEDNIVPWVLCKKCGSQDTRIVREQTEPAAYEDAESLRFQRDQLKARLARLEHAIQESLSDPETTLSYETKKAFQDCLSDWPMETKEQS